MQTVRASRLHRKQSVPGARGPGAKLLAGVGPCVGPPSEWWRSQDGEWQNVEAGMPTGVWGTSCGSSLAGAENSYEGGRSVSLERQVPARLAASCMPGYRA